MRRFALRSLLMSGALALTIAHPNPASADEDARISAELQVAMQRHIDRSLVNGAILDIDLETGQLLELYPTTAHPMIMVGDGYYVLCADLATADGAQYEVDYYLAETERGFRVFRTEVDNRSVLRGLMGSGQVSAL